MTDTGRLRPIVSAVVGLGVFVVIARVVVSGDGGMGAAAIAAALVASPYLVLTLLAKAASWIGWFIATVAMVALTAWVVAGLASDAQAGIAFIWIIPLQLILAAAASWRSLRS